MKILTVDIGTGTQDIFLYDSQLDLENGYKMVLPSPTMIVRGKLRQAARRREPVLLTGVTMGGGPSSWAVEDHLKAGLPVYAISAAARTIKDSAGKLLCYQAEHVDITQRRHAEVALQALEAGKSVYNEKPLAIKREDGLKMLEIAKAKKLLVGGAPDTFLGSPAPLASASAICSLGACC